jgi:hypothetical protein
MAKSRAEMMELVAKLFTEYAEFQRRRPDLPQGDLVNLSEDDLEILVAAFRHDRVTDAEETDPTPPKPWLH